MEILSRMVHTEEVEAQLLLILGDIKSLTGCCTDC